MRSFVRTLAVGLLVCGGCMWLWGARDTQAASPGQVIQPGDVATPTPTFAIILVPTATPTPTPGSVPQTSRDPAIDGAGIHADDGFSLYTVKPGDTLLTVALEVGIDVGDLPCAIAPTYDTRLPLVIGNVLEVPPTGWRCHQVEAGESLTQVAARYGVDSSKIINVAWNELDGSALGEKPLPDGRFLRIPPSINGDADGGFLTFMLEQPLSVSPITAYAIGGSQRESKTVVGPLPKDWPYGSGNFMWPVYGWLSQGYRGDHRAIDIAAPPGTFVTAADRGVVMRAGWNYQGYGNFVVIDHNIDFITLYAHLTEIFVQEGDVVAQGQIIGTIGSTGNSTGPHLHFEIRDFGRRTNPLELLMR